MTEEILVLIIDDDRSVLKLMNELVLQLGYTPKTTQSGSEASALLHAGAFDLVISDLRLKDASGMDLLKLVKTLDPEVPFICITGYADSDSAIEMLRLGAFDYLAKPFHHQEFQTLVKNAVESRSLRRKVRLLLQEEPPHGHMIGISPAMLEIYKMIGTLSRNSSTVLIMGESGTGKELIARAIHKAGLHKAHQFMAINCAAFPETLLESELFGYQRGAFTGAVADKAGLIELASRGTLFLDEVGEMSPAIQVKLLRVLQERKIRRLGGRQEIDVDVRVISATNRDLEKEVREGRFRDDLYYRLAVVPLKVPPLRERQGDLILLLWHFLSKHNRSLGKNVLGVTEDALSALESYPWPGNVRELENVLERAVLLETTNYLQRDRLPEHILRPRLEEWTEFPEISRDSGIDLEAWLRRAEENLIRQALETAEGNQTHAAELLHISYASLRHRLKTLETSRRRRLKFPEPDDSHKKD
ncbi:MAG: sigma-54-dependent Fis family transcriptional regulator [Acidobacteria bacterium]|nr:sigma-54-dependent Fis family transcriptional regulator [Acidobacteriota bacterium]